MSESLDCQTITNICYPPIAPVATGAFFNGVYGFTPIPTANPHPTKKEVNVEVGPAATSAFFTGVYGYTPIPVANLQPTKNEDNIKAEAITVTEEHVDPTAVRCVVDLEYMPRDTCIICPHNHALSKENLANMVHFTCGKSLDSVLEHEGRVKCPVPECEYHYSTYEIANNVEEDVFNAYMAMIDRVQYQRAFEKVLQDLEDKKADEKEAVEMVVVQEAIRNQFRCDHDYNEYGRVFKCPICAFGPIDKRECDDLMAHHEEDRGNGVRISNACPMCGYFASDVSGWAYWDGTFLQGKRMRDTKKVVEKYQKEIDVQQLPLKKEVETIYEERRKLAASFHPYAKLLDEINPNRYEHYHCPNVTREHFYRETVMPGNNITSHYTRMNEMEVTDKQAYSANTFGRMLVNQLLKTYFVGDYGKRTQLQKLEEKVRLKNRAMHDILKAKGKEIASELENMGYENKIVWGVYEDSDEEEDDSYY